jgi:hypothetical protein
METFSVRIQRSTDLTFIDGSLFRILPVERRDSLGKYRWAIESGIRERGKSVGEKGTGFEVVQVQAEMSNLQFRSEKGEERLLVSKP